MDKKEKDNNHRIELTEKSFFQTYTQIGNIQIRLLYEIRLELQEIKRNVIEWRKNGR